MGYVTIYEDTRMGDTKQLGMTTVCLELGDLPQVMQFSWGKQGFQPTTKILRVYSIHYFQTHAYNQSKLETIASLLGNGGYSWYSF